MAKRLGERLGLHVYDKEILKMTSEESGIRESYFHLADEKAGNKLLYRIIHSLIPENGTPSLGSDLISSDNLFRFQSSVIRKLAQEESCIIIGRCADYVLRHRNPLRLFFYADIADRMERCRKRNEEQKSLNHDVLRKIITQTDKNRSRYYEFLSGQKWGAKENYDLCINTSSADTEKIIQCVISLL